MSIGLVFTVLGWAAAVALAEIAVSCAYRGASSRWRFLPCWSDRTADRGWLLPELSGSACAVLLIFLGVLSPLAGGILAALLFAVAAVPLARLVWRAARRGEGRSAARSVALLLLLMARTARSFLAEDLRALTWRRQAGEPPPAPAPPSPPAAVPGAVAPQAREVPPLREDPALGPAPEPAEVAGALAAANVELPEVCTAVVAWVAQFVPEDSNHQDWFLHVAAAFMIALGEAYHSHAGTAVDEVGLDPAYGAALLDLGDAAAGVSGDAVLTYQRFHVIYEEIIKFVENGGVLPFKSREFFSGSGGAPAADESAA